MIGNLTICTLKAIKSFFLELMCSRINMRRDIRALKGCLQSHFSLVKAFISNKMNKPIDKVPEMLAELWQ